MLLHPLFQGISPVCLSPACGLFKAAPCSLAVIIVYIILRNISIGRTAKVIAQYLCKMSIAQYLIVLYNIAIIGEGAKNLLPRNGETNDQ